MDAACLFDLATCDQCICNHKSHSFCIRHVPYAQCLATMHCFPINDVSFFLHCSFVVEFSCCSKEKERLMSVFFFNCSMLHSLHHYKRVHNMIELYLKIQIKEIFQLLQESAILPPVSNYIPMIIDLLGTFLTVLQNIGMFSHFQMPAICFQLS